MKHYYLFFLFVILAMPFSYGMKKVSLDSILGPQNIILKTYKWVDKAFNSYDTAYVAGTGKYFNVRIKNDNWIDNYTLSIANNKQISLNSDICCHLGASIGYRAVTVGYMMNVNNAFKKDTPSRKRADFSFTCSRVVFNAYYAVNKDPIDIVKFGNYSAGNDFSYRFNGLEAESFGVDLYYIFNNKKFSQAAAYGYSRIQKKSAGTFYAGVSLSMHDLKLDFSGLPQDLKIELPDNIYSYRFKYNDYSLMLGYGYNWVFAKRWLLSVAFTPTVGFKHCGAESIDGEGNLFSVNSNTKLSFVYNLKQYFAGFIGQYNTYWYRSENYSFTNSLGSINICAGVRF